MAYVFPHNYNSPRLRLTEDDYWDFTISKDRSMFKHIWDGSLNDRCLFSQIDINNDECIDGDWILSDGAYAWPEAVSEGLELRHIGYTGVDNGQIRYRRDQISNQQFTDIFSGSTYTVPSGDTRLKLHAVSGTTLQYEYPMTISGGTAKLNGGFFQGFTKTKCDEYYILPTNFNSGYPQTWLLEFVLKKEDFEPESHKTLNDKYPENKGIFFYIGTRAENKWVYNYRPDDNMECFTLAPSNYVSGVEITKEDYIIENFVDDEMIKFPKERWTDPDQFMSDFTDLSFYDPIMYDRPCGSIDGLEDFLDFTHRAVPNKNPDACHTTVSDCYCKCCNSTKTYTVVHKKRSCGCGVQYNIEHKKRENDCKSYGCEIFGDDEGYIGDYYGLDIDTDYVDNELDIRIFDYDTDGGYGLKEVSDGYYEFNTDNKFLMFDRTKSGQKANTWKEGSYLTYYGRREKFKDNLFLLMNRTKTGYTVSTIDELREKANSQYSLYTFYKDIYDNAMAFRIDDDGRIGYRILTVDCSASGEDKTMIMEGYSVIGAVADEEWTAVSVRIDAVGLDGMRLRFYVNGRLVYISKVLPMIKLRELDDMPQKQEGVPFNISIGGGTQGLAETVQMNYMLDPDRLYPLERYFAGTFIGYLSQFRFHGCALESIEIWENSSYGLSLARRTGI